jgi:hypothetical protein
MNVNMIINRSYMAITSIIIILLLIIEITIIIIIIIVIININIIISIIKLLRYFSQLKVVLTSPAFKVTACKLPS